MAMTPPTGLLCSWTQEAGVSNIHVHGTAVGRNDNKGTLNHVAIKTETVDRGHGDDGSQKRDLIAARAEPAAG